MAQNLLLLLKIDFGGSEGKRRVGRRRGCRAGAGVGRVAKERVDCRSSDKALEPTCSGQSMIYAERTFG